MKKVIIPFFFILMLSCAPGPLLIDDVRNLAQDGKAYLNPEIADVPLISSGLQNQFNQTYDSLFFEPWHYALDSVSIEPLIHFLDYYKTNLGWGENRMPRDSTWIIRLGFNADTSSFPNAGWKGITVANSNLRTLPTNKPIFRDFAIPGEGYPFDYLQVSSLAVNTPVWIVHTSLDGSWHYVRSHIASGWLPARDVAEVTTSLRRTWKSHHLATVIEDEIPVHTLDGQFLFHAPLGSAFPLIDSDDRQLYLYCAVPDQDQKAIATVGIFDKSAAISKPMALTQSNLARLMGALMGEPYGWGGLFQNRDCSATIKDLFAPFGIMLPRHSAHQVKSGFDYFELAGLSNQEKEKIILSNGIPFLTLLWLPGHIMLYIGQDEDHPLVFHNLWGLRTKSWFGKEGRKTVGKSVVTTLSPDRGVRKADRSRSILKRIQGMSFVVPPDSIHIDF